MSSIVAEIFYLAFNAYALGLLAFVITTWIRHPRVEPARVWLSAWYEPVLLAMRRRIRPVRLGQSRVDLTPVLLFLAIVLLRQIVVALLVVQP